MEVILHIYDVTNTGSVKTNNTILQINKIFKDGIGLGGIFHSAVQVFGNEEWSFGYCDQGSGVFSCPPGKNPVYTYRESIVLGKTNESIYSVNQILRELSREWPGDSYDLLSRNCNHFCDEFCERLGVSKLPAWINRFANAGDTAMEVAGNTALRFRQAKDEIVSASKVAYRFLSSVTSNMTVTAESPSNSNRGSPRFQAPWFKNLMSIGAKPPNSPELENQDEDTHPQRQQSTGLIRQNSRDGYIRQNSRDGHIRQNSRDGHNRENSLDGHFRQNSLDGHFRENSLDGHFRQNSLDGHFLQNSLDGHIRQNSLDGHIRPNSRDGHIRQNSLDGHIRQNSRDGHIQQNSRDGHLRQNSKDDI